ncbi:TCR/Tet family MFS transporter [Sulfitobacter sp. LCG007]
MRPSVIFILATVMTDAMGVGLILPVMPDLLHEVRGGTLAGAALWGGVLTTVFAVMQFFFGPVVGGLSDRFGRRPVLLISLAALAIDFLVMAVAGSIWILLAGRVFGGIFAATTPTAGAYMADISKGEDRAANFGLIGAAFGAGFVIGPLIGGLLGEYGTRAPFYAAAMLCTATFILGCFTLRETLTVQSRRKFSWRRANPFGSLLQLNRVPGLGALLWVYFLFQIAFMVYPAIWAYYGKARFDWDPAMIGVSLATYGVTIALVQGLLIRPVIRLMGQRGAVIFGHVVETLSFVALGVITDGNLALAIIVAASLAAVLTPAIQGMMSDAVSADAQGELQGSLTSLMALAMILSPLVMTGVFAWFTRPGVTPYLPGAPFLLSALLMIAALIIFLRSTPGRSLADDAA